VPDKISGLVVSNHLGYIDIIAHGTIFPPRFTPSEEVMRMPILGMIIRSSNPVVVNRRSSAASKRSLRDFAKTMRRGMYLIVYPEGTSTDGKSGVLPFKSTSFEAATTTGLPILPVLTRYIEPEGQSSVCWYGDMTFMPHFWRVLALPSIEAELHFLPPVFPEGRSRKELSSAVHDIMSAGYRKILSGEKEKEEIRKEEG
jgi:lyso-ornithine lipid O-acyltransferase